MKCPTCPDAVLSMTSRNGIEIDFCPTCRGVWLDRGELDKIIERSTENATTESRPQESSGAYRQHEHHKYKKKKSFLHELFD